MKGVIVDSQAYFVYVITRVKVVDDEDDHNGSILK